MPQKELQRYSISLVFSLDYNDLTNKPSSSGSSLFNQELIGTKDGINSIFSTLIPFTLTTTRVYVNGQRMKLSVDYNETDNTTITFLFLIYPNDGLIIDFNP